MKKLARFLELCVSVCFWLKVAEKKTWRYSYSLMGCFVKFDVLEKSYSLTP